ncbi:lipoprotein LppM [Mycolicibacter sinensis]|uniref:Lipoprotein LppM n=2 Tax=Mycolicibacter sinensis (strain JDM601) TaxID=875328 RepID=F5Z1Q5_MYCSD|nr:lipoprotein LppM [Mycolicibacter sinensis]
MHVRRLLPTFRRFTAYRRLLALVVLVLITAPMMVGCVRVKATITVSPNDQVSGQIIAAAKPRNDNDTGPKLSADVPFAQKIAITSYNRDGYVGSQAVFSDLTFAELPQLAEMNRDAAGVNLALRRAGNLVILEGRVDLTSLSDPTADVELSVAFPGEVTSTNGERLGDDTVQWRLKPGVVSTMSAQAHYTDPSTRSFVRAAMWLVLSTFAVAGAVALIAWGGRDRSPRFSSPHDDAG